MWPRVWAISTPRAAARRPTAVWQGSVQILSPPPAGHNRSGAATAYRRGHIKDKSLGGKDELANLRALCSTCNQGAKNVTSEKPTTIWLLGQVRRAGHDEQRAVFEWLRTKFGEDR